MQNREISFCDQCYELEGKMCHNAGCIFCRRTMDEVAYILDVLLIRPKVENKILRL